MTLKPRKRTDASSITAAALGETSKVAVSDVASEPNRATNALNTARRVNPRLPPAEIEPDDKAVNHNMRVRKSTLRALGKAADAEGMSVKQFIMRAIADKGVFVAAPDLENGKVTPWRDR
ncbi:hypothetical protein [Gluconobacter kondonii]|uniref:Uncharacterized protein n=1 Tax=Gluconobacter kondonii TaxID=941463 RepID=A0ABQ5WXT6_9PROT|nr:hypothetical protein [Gluconobacter kondonii]GBR41744.1 hypothetical protein AA3266_2852 [Gluconobacter kondonii NBRC 3266]GLQ67441.1 hypothetical protein GCM10007870_30260 [Gluconobacter kondonii]